MPAEPSSTVIRWLLDGDPSIRWPMLHDLNDTAPDIVAAERAKVATWTSTAGSERGWTSRVGDRGEEPAAMPDGGRCRVEVFRVSRSHGGESRGGKRQDFSTTGRRDRERAAIARGYFRFVVRPSTLAMRSFAGEIGAASNSRTRPSISSPQWQFLAASTVLE